MINFIKYISNIRTKVISLGIILIIPFVLTSCEKEFDSKLGISVRTSEVSCEPGSVFVKVESERSWTLALIDEKGEVDWAFLSETEGQGSKANIILSYEENTTEHHRTLTIVIDNGKNWKSVDFTQLASGERPDDPDDPDNPIDPDDPTINPKGKGWIELPAMDDENLGYFYHSFTMDGKTHRNYSFGWSQTDGVAIWVAYPLCKLYTNKKVARTNAWNLDPLLKHPYKSSAPFGGYGGSYDRGHQLPSADRLCSYEANAQTFYGTNMTPQLSDLNQQAWSTLEMRIRDIANNSDTTYVVTGCVVDPKKGTTVDSDGMKLTIPGAYFKAVLRYSKYSTTNQWEAVAYYVEHKAAYSISSNWIITVDELEEKLGMDFFVNLPDATETQVESRLPSNLSPWL